MLLLALAAAAAQPQPGALRTFGDWTVGCDNARRCQAVALVPKVDASDTYLMLVVRRDPAGRMMPTLSLSIEDELPAGPLSLRVDGKVVARVTGHAPLPVDTALASALGQGRRATLTDMGGRLLAAASLKGLAAAFLHLDEQQRRLGTVGALIRRGSRPDATVPTPPALPSIVQPRVSLRAPRTLAPAAAARLIGSENAICDYASSPVKPRAFRLDAQHSLALVDHPCGNGAYNASTSAFVLDESGRATAARFDTPAGFGPEDAHILVNTDWDPGDRRLAGFAKARGLADCGVGQAFAWDGARFRLVHQEVMGECRGSRDYIVTWRATVVTTAR